MFLSENNFGKKFSGSSSAQEPVRLRITLNKENKKNEEGLKQWVNPRTSWQKKE